MPKYTRRHIDAARRQFKRGGRLIIVTFEGERYFTDSYTLGKVADFPVVEAILAEAGAADLADGIAYTHKGVRAPLEFAENPGPSISSFVTDLSRHKVDCYELFFQRSFRARIHGETITAVELDAKTDTVIGKVYVEEERFSGLFSKTSSGHAYYSPSGTTEKPMVICGSVPGSDTLADLLTMPLPIEPREEIPAA